MQTAQGETVQVCLADGGMDGVATARGGQGQIEKGRRVVRPSQGLGLLPCVTERHVGRTLLAAAQGTDRNVAGAG